MSETRKCMTCGGTLGEGCRELPDIQKFCPAERPAATPPTPDLDAVVARVRRIAANLHDIADSDGVHHSGWGGRVHRAAASLEIEAESLLAAVSRPAEARGEPVAWLVVEDTDRKMSAHLFSEAANLTAETHRIANPAHDYAVQPLYAHPAPSGGDAAPRPEPGEVSEAMVEAVVQAVRTAVVGLPSEASWNDTDAAIRIHVRAALAAQREPRP